MRGEPTFPVRVIQRSRLNPTCAIVQLCPSGPAPEVRTGQTVNVSLQRGENERVSCFTVLRTRPGGEFSLLVRRSGRGGVSDALVDGSTEPGLRVSASFLTAVPLSTTDVGPVLCLTAGSGAAVLGGVADAGLLARAEITFFGRTEDCVTVPRAVLRHVTEGAVAGAPPRWTAWDSTARGRPTAADVERLFARGPSPAAVVACGPGGFCDLVERTCAELGVDSSRLVVESFGDRQDARRGGPGADASTTVVDFFGRAHAVEWPRDETLLSAMLKAGLDAPYSCRAGVCSTCQCTVLAGAAEMSADLGLSDDEKASGLVLACQLRPLSDAVAVRFSAVPAGDLEPGRHEGADGGSAVLHEASASR